MKKVIAIIQARMASTRLPEKIMLPIGGKPMLEWVFNRTLRAREVTNVVVATTIDPSDNSVVSLCKEKGFQVFRGSVHDVLDRYYQTAKKMQADVIVRITADCPLIDPCLIDEAVNLLVRGSFSKENGAYPLQTSFDFVANRLPPPWGRSYPIGLDLEVFTFDFLEDAWRSATELHQREHVTPYFYEDIPAENLKFMGPDIRYRVTKTRGNRVIALIHHTTNFGDRRWTVDTPDDLKLVRSIVSHFKDDKFTWEDVLRLTMEKPELNLINAHVHHKSHLDVDDQV